LRRLEQKGYISHTEQVRRRAERLERVGEVDGRAIFAEAGVAEPEVIHRLEREPNVFLPFLRPR
jgi:hypothetical protein